MHVINKLQATEISVALIFLFAIIQVIHNENVGTPLTIKLLDDIGADKACRAGDENRLMPQFNSFHAPLLNPA